MRLPPLARTPDYPIPEAQALRRLAYLRERAELVARAQVALARERVPDQEAIAELAGELEGLVEERVELEFAVEHIGQVRGGRHAPPVRCRWCRKVRHGDPATADLHARALRTVDDRRNRAPVRAYACPHGEGWHVGHAGAER